MKVKVIGLMILFCIATPAVAEVDTPSHLFGQLFVDVQMQRVFPDGKSFVDALPNDAPAAIVQRYEEEGASLASTSPLSFTETSLCRLPGAVPIAAIPARTCAATSTICGRSSNAGPTA